MNLGKELEYITGASLNEPHINSTAVCELHIYNIYLVRRSREIYAQDSSMDISAKYSCAYSHA